MLVVTDEATVLDNPAEGSLNHPPPRQDLEAFGLRVAADDLQDDVGLLPGPGDQTPGVSAIGKCPFDERVSGPRAFQYALAAITVLEVGAVDMNSKQPAIGIGQDVALAAADLLSRIVTLAAPP